MTPVAQTYTLLPDFRMTRRKRYHILLDAEREHVMAAIDLAEVFEHILDNDRRTLVVETETQNYIVTINRLPGPPGEPPRGMLGYRDLGDAIAVINPPSVD